MAVQPIDIRPIDTLDEVDIPKPCLGVVAHDIKIDNQVDAKNVGEYVKGTYGNIFVQADGGFSYSPNSIEHSKLPKNAQDVFTIKTADGLEKKVFSINP